MSSGSRGSGRGGDQAGGNSSGRGKAGGTQRERGQGRGASTSRGDQQEDDGGPWTEVVSPHRRAVRGRGRGDGGPEVMGQRGGGRQAPSSGGQRVTADQMSSDQRGGDQRAGGQKLKKGLIAYPKDPKPWDMKGYGDKKSEKDNREAIAREISPWPLTKGPKSTRFGNAPVATPDAGSSKGKDKDKAGGQGEGGSIRIHLYPEGSGLAGEVVEAVEVEDPALEIPRGILAVPSRPPSFRSARPSARPRTRSEESAISFHSEVFYDRKGQPRYYLKNPNPDAREKFYQQIGGMYDNTNARMLDLVPGQGGTFGFGDWYRTERGREFYGEQQVMNNPDMTKHLSFFNKKVRLIGTVKCVSCTGVYFEITGNRCFCAHINTWHNEDTFDGAYLKERDREWDEIVEAVEKRLHQHAKDYGWDPEKDVYKETLWVVCPLPEAQAYAVPEALRRFLGLPYMPYVGVGHGFIMCPGVRDKDDGGPIGHLLEVKFGVKNKETGKLEAVRDTFPEEIDRIAYKHSNNDHVLEQWCYTVGQQWHHVEPYYDSRFGRRIHVKQDSTKQTFARLGYMYQDGKEVKSNIVRDEEYKMEEAPGAKWYFTGQEGEPIVLEGFDP